MKKNKPRKQKILTSSGEKCENVIFHSGNEIKNKIKFFLQKFAIFSSVGAVV